LLVVCVQQFPPIVAAAICWFFTMKPQIYYVGTTRDFTRLLTSNLPHSYPHPILPLASQTALLCKGYFWPNH